MSCLTTCSYVVENNHFSLGVGVEDDFQVVPFNLEAFFKGVFGPSLLESGG